MKWNPPSISQCVLTRLQTSVIKSNCHLYLGLLILQVGSAKNYSSLYTVTLVLLVQRYQRKFYLVWSSLGWIRKIFVAKAMMEQGIWRVAFKGRCQNYWTISLCLLCSLWFTCLEPLCCVCMYCPICSQHAFATGRDLHLLPVFTETPAITGGEGQGTWECDHTKLVSLCKTRWVACIESLRGIPEVSNPESLQDIATEDGWNSESSRKASSLLSAVTQFGFIHTFTVVRHGLGFLKGITTSLQSRAHDIVCAYNEIVHVVQRVE